MIRTAGYRNLCTLSLLHEYYNGMIPEQNMLLYLSPSMKRKANNEGVILQCSPSGIRILYEIDEAKREIDSEVSIIFGVRFNDPNFFNFTTAGLTSFNQILFCSNDEVQADSEGKTDYKRLHEGIYVDKDSLASKQDFEGIETVKDIVLMVQLNLKQLIDQAHDDDRTSSIPVEKYLIRFAARETPWLFWFWLKQGKLKNLIEGSEDYEKLSLEMKEAPTEFDGIRFEKLEETVDLNSQRAVRFLSSAPLKLGVNSVFTLSLVYQGELGSKTLIEQLPHPAKNCLESLVVQNESKIVASSHVSL